MSGGSTFHTHKSTIEAWRKAKAAALPKKEEAMSTSLVTLMSEGRGHQDDGHDDGRGAGHHPTLVFLLPMNNGFGGRLARLQRDAMTLQYHIAVLSTLGGAHHLCNKPDTALVLACQQEAVARRLGSSTLLLRSKVFQAVNLGLLGQRKQSRALFRRCEDMARASGWTDMASFVDASRQWLVVELRLTKEQHIKNTLQQQHPEHEQQWQHQQHQRQHQQRYFDLQDDSERSSARHDGKYVVDAARFPNSASVEELTS